MGSVWMCCVDPGGGGEPLSLGGHEDLNLACLLIPSRLLLVDTHADIRFVGGVGGHGGRAGRAGVVCVEGGRGVRLCGVWVLVWLVMRVLGRFWWLLVGCGLVLVGVGCEGGSGDGFGGVGLPGVVVEGSGGSCEVVGSVDEVEWLSSLEYEGWSRWSVGRRRSDPVRRMVPLSLKSIERHEDRLGVLLPVLKSIVELESSRVASWGLYVVGDDLLGFVWLAGSGPVCEEAVQLAGSYDDVVVRVGADDSVADVFDFVSGFDEVYPREVYGRGDSELLVVDGVVIPVRAVVRSPRLGFSRLDGFDIGAWVPALELDVASHGLVHFVPDELAAVDAKLVTGAELEAMFDWLGDLLRDHIGVEVVLTDSREFVDAPTDLRTTTRYPPEVPEYDPDMPVAGLYYTDLLGEVKQALLTGELVYERPCVYIDSYDSLDETALPDRFFIRLPEVFTRYDPVTNGFWYGRRGPVFPGDIVSAGGGTRSFRPNDEQEALCEAPDEWHAPNSIYLHK